MVTDTPVGVIGLAHRHKLAIAIGDAEKVITPSRTRAVSSSLHRPMSRSRRFRLRHELTVPVSDGLKASRGGRGLRQVQMSNGSLPGQSERRLAGRSVCET